MKIALVIPELHKQGGTERCMASLGEALVARGHEVVVFSSTKSPTALAGVRWYRVPMIRRPLVLRFASFVLMNTLARLAARVLRRERFDVVHSTGGDVLRPSVVTFHACSAAFARRLWAERRAPAWQRWSRLRRWSNLLTYWMIAGCERYVLQKGAGRVVAVSRALEREIRACYQFDDGRVAVVSNGVDPAEFSDGAAPCGRDSRAEIGSSAEDTLVLFVGYNWERKGLDTLVSALALLREREHDARVLLVVVGGRGRPSYEDAIRARLGDAVRFLATRVDMARVYAAADLCVLPTRHEPFGLPVLEAMASGLAVVVSRGAGVAEVITEGLDGVLLDDPTDAEELARRLQPLVADPQCRSRLGQQARKTAERYSWDEIASRMEAIYQEFRPTTSRPADG